MSNKVTSMVGRTLTRERIRVGGLVYEERKKELSAEDEAVLWMIENDVSHRIQLLLLGLLMQSPSATDGYGSTAKQEWFRAVNRIRKVMIPSS